MIYGVTHFARPISGAQADISAFLHAMPSGTDSGLLAEALVSVGSVGGMMAMLSYGPWQRKFVFIRNPHGRLNRL